MNPISAGLGQCCEDFALPLSDCPKRLMANGHRGCTGGAHGHSFSTGRSGKPIRGDDGSWYLAGLLSVMSMYFRNLNALTAWTEQLSLTGTKMDDFLSRSYSSMPTNPTPPFCETMPFLSGWEMAQSGHLLRRRQSMAVDRRPTPGVLQIQSSPHLHFFMDALEGREEKERKERVTPSRTLIAVNGGLGRKEDGALAAPNPV
ncbi:hypothetical protein ACRALDRAFT_208777 [Sodiomyces alcalophilus JCM 7366]|uniref:uncharacterized protein n=1 Tax=Sodiomyces alcalophilus JCM 7366 TaxID=591952 RepID=UPI0039B61C52